MRPGVAALAIGCGLLVVTGTASAAPVAITYSLSGSMVGFDDNIGWNQYRPFTGTMTVIYEGTGKNTLYGPPGGFAGPARIDTFFMDAAAQGSYLYSRYYSGQVEISGGAQAGGLFGTGAGVALPIDVLGAGVLRCVGSAYWCSGYSNRNISIGLIGSVVPYLSGAPTAAGHYMKVNLGVNDLAVINPLVPPPGGNFGVNGILTANEVSRILLPEPSVELPVLSDWGIAVLVCLLLGLAFQGRFLASAFRHWA